MAAADVFSVDTKHDDMIHDAQFDYYGKQLATCSSDRTVKIFSLENDTPTLISQLTGHDGPVWQVAWAHPKFGNVLATCGYDNKVIVWKSDSRQGGEFKRVFEYGEHTSSVNSVAWAPHESGLRLACASSDCTVSVLTHREDNSWASEKIRAHQVGCNAVSWAPMAVDESGAEALRLVTAGCDNLAKVWRYQDGSWMEEAELAGHGDWVRDVAWAPGLGAHGSTIATCSQDRTVRVWRFADGAWTSTVVGSFDTVLWRVSWSLTGNILAVAGGDNKVTLWKESLDGQWKCLANYTDGARAAAEGNEAMAADSQE